MSIASDIAVIAEQAAATTFYGGYAQMRDGTIRRFPTGVCELDKRNNNGRCTHARYIYADGSRLTFKWSDARGPSFEVKA